MHLPASPALTRTLRNTAKAVAGLGVVCGVAATLAAPAQSAPGAMTLASSRATTGGGAHAGAAALVADRGTEGTSRTTNRSALSPRTAASAPARSGPAVTSFGVSGVEAVAKPTPKPIKKTLGDGRKVTVSDGTANTGAFYSEGLGKGLVPQAAKVYSAVRSTFGISNIGGRRGGDPGDHGSGHALDVMCNTSQGDAVAAYVMAHAREFNVKYIIWQQRIWFPGSGTWRHMADRGSITANHYDHVHISIN